ncbi:uncharacterized protein LOC133184531 [Saccostrea echinata]|uniref:uncharacterized protein LOC133184531 n=1 Tax=Saccostrea echinata TaxID=191078 RepID=UPI002A82BEFD|nr:uncharacterized protein LOC133184531 [Saccostrea echinata]
MTEDGKLPRAEAGESRPSRENKKLTVKARSYKLQEYYDSFRKLKSSVTQIKNLMLENRDTELIRKRYSSWLDNYEHFLNLFDVLKTQTEDEQEKSKLLLDHQDYDIFLINFKKEVEAFFSYQDTVKNEKMNVNSVNKAQSRNSRTTKSSCVSLEKLKEEQKLAELEARKASLKKRKELELAKLELTLKEEEFNIETDIAISNAKTEVLQKYELESEIIDTHSDKFCEEEITPRRNPPMPSPRIIGKDAELGSQISVSEKHLNPNASVFVPNISMETKQQNAMQDVVNYLRRPLPEIKKFSGDPLEFQRFMRQFHAKVVMNTSNDDERLNYLEQMTQGEANRVVSGYTHMSGDKGYQAAMKQLEERYGDSELIVTSFIKKALDWPMIKDAKMLDEFALFLVECQNASESIDCVSVLDYAENIKRLLSKLPIYLHDRWRTAVLKIKETKRRIGFSDFVTFVKTEAKKSNDPIYGVSSLSGNSRSQPDKHQKRTVASGGLSSEKESPGALVLKCEFCGGAGHVLIDCYRFQRISIQERYNFMKNKGLCYGCLKKGHVTKKCRNRLKCISCGRQHPTILHDPSRSTPNYPINREEHNNSVSSSSNVDQSVIHTGNSDVGASCDTGAVEQTSAMAIIPVRIKLKNKNHSVITYAFFDSGSSVTFCSENLMRQLGVSGKKCNITLNTIGEPYQLVSQSVRGLQLCDMNMTEFIDLPKIYTKDRMPVTHEHIPKKEEISKWHHLSNITLPNVAAEIGLLIGSNVPDAYAPFEVVTGPSGSPHATRTRLGWIVWNVLREVGSGSYDVNKVTLERYCECDTKLEELVKASINLDFPEHMIAEKKEHSVEDKTFLSQVEKSIKQVNGHYSIGLPFRNNSVSLPNNMIQGLQRLECLKKKMLKNPQFRTDYTVFMNKLFEKDFVEPVPEMQLQRDDGRVWYLPHHGIYHTKKPGKIRVVFDCSAVFRGVSLNSQLLQGPDLTNSLLGVLLRFRQERIAIQGDIESMFHQVAVPEEDRDCMRFFWWKDGNLSAEPKQYRMKVHIFGAVSSPTCCSYALKKTAEEHGNDYDQSIQNTIMKNMYVDDCLASVDTEEKAKYLIKDLMALCKQGGFRLTK